MFVAWEAVVLVVVQAILVVGFDLHVCDHHVLCLFSRVIDPCISKLFYQTVNVLLQILDNLLLAPIYICCKNNTTLFLQLTVLFLQLTVLLI